MNDVALKTVVGAGAAAGASLGPVGMAVGAAACLCVGGAFCWFARGKKENKNHAENQAIISKLEKRLRENEKRLSDTTSLAADEINRLRAENSQLRSELRREKAAA